MIWSELRVRVTTPPAKWRLGRVEKSAGAMTAPKKMMPPSQITSESNETKRRILIMSDAGALRLLAQHFSHDACQVAQHPSSIAAVHRAVHGRQRLRLQIGKLVQHTSSTRRVGHVVRQQFVALIRNQGVA